MYTYWLNGFNADCQAEMLHSRKIKFQEKLSND